MSSRIVISVVFAIVASAFAIACAVSDYKKKRKLLLLFTILCQIASLFPSLHNIIADVKKPVIKPVDGMLQEGNIVTIENIGDENWDIYYSTDPEILPQSKDAKKYNGQIYLTESGYLSAQSCFLGKWSEIEKVNMITYEDSIKYGVVIGERGEISESEDIANTSKTVSDKQSFDYYNLPDNVVSGWGDSGNGRLSYTIDGINSGDISLEQIIFNSISDSTIGDEKNFVGARPLEMPDNEKIIWNANLITVVPENQYLIRIYGHNNNPYGYDAVAEDVMTCFLVPHESGRTVVVHGLIKSSNSVPDTYWDGVVFTSDKKFHLEYVKGSATLYNNCIAQNGFQLPDEIVNGWTLVGFDKIDGRIPGCYNFSFVITIQVKVVEN